MLGHRCPELREDPWDGPPHLHGGGGGGGMGPRSWEELGGDAIRQPCPGTQPSAPLLYAHPRWLCPRVPGGWPAEAALLLCPVLGPAPPTQALAGAVPPPRVCPGPRPPQTSGHLLSLTPAPPPQESTCGSAPRATPAVPARWRRSWPTAAGPSWRPPSWTAAVPCRPRSPPSCRASMVSGPPGLGPPGH